MRKFTLGVYRVSWRTFTVTLLVWRVRLVRMIWGDNDAAQFVTRARKHAVIPLLRALGAAVDPSADVETGLILHNAHGGLHHLTIGPRCHVGKDCLIDLAAPVTLEPRCTLSMRVTLITHIDVGQTPLRDEFYPVERAPIMICEGAYLGANVTVLHGVEIGRCAVVAAGAVVRQPVAEKTIVGGVPAQVIRKLETK